MVGEQERRPAANGATRLERTAALLSEAIDLLRAEMRESRGDTDKDGDHDSITGERTGGPPDDI
jgi:hypothetical protein